MNGADVLFMPAGEADVAAITALSIRAFHSDIEVGATTLKGPPGYDSPTFHLEMLRQATFFCKMLLQDSIIGAFWFIQQNDHEAYLYRIFVAPECHRLGIGRASFHYMFSRFPEVTAWTLKTPTWNNRTLHFYQSLGFVLTEETERFRFFTRRHE